MGREMKRLRERSDGERDKEIEREKERWGERERESDGEREGESANVRYCHMLCVLCVYVTYAEVLQ